MWPSGLVSNAYLHHMYFAPVAPTCHAAYCDPVIHVHLEGTGQVASQLEELFAGFYTLYFNPRLYDDTGYNQDKWQHMLGRMREGEGAHLGHYRHVRDMRFLLGRQVAKYNTNIKRRPYIMFELEDTNNFYPAFRDKSKETQTERAS